MLDVIGPYEMFALANQLADAGPPRYALPVVAPTGDRLSPQAGLISVIAGRRYDPATKDGGDVSRNFLLHVLVASSFQDAADPQPAKRFSENVIATQTRVRIPLGPPLQVHSSSAISSDLRG